METARWGARLMGLLMLLAFLFLMASMQARLRRMKEGDDSAGARPSGAGRDEWKGRDRSPPDLPPGAVR